MGGAAWFVLVYMLGQEPPTSCRYRASSVVPCVGARYGHHSTLALLGQRSPPAIATERARRPSVPELVEITTIDQCPPELSPLVPSDSPHAQIEIPTVDGKLLATPQRHGRVSHPLTDIASVEPHAKFRYKGEYYCSHRAPAVVVTILVLAGKASHITRSGGQSYPRSRRTAAGIYPRFSLLSSYNNNPIVA
ncbi:hypothetical protein Acr_08g0011070 [Actinidia rufa]|uniref:Uncharacterized protein n=1 Tax=Actinidia rufa TaxID=165716 RepID=A0A7J0F1Y6_9ERIC|nr:hypothetical protein Acr_08g0011070 [Actinidia rufa]